MAQRKQIFNMTRVVLIAVIVVMFPSLHYSQIRPSNGLASQLLADDEDAATVAREERLSIEEVTQRLRLRSVDLNSDGLKDAILSGLICGQNCTYWIYRRTENFWSSIPIEASAQDLKLLATKTNGYFDLLATHYWTCCEASLMMYRFDGTKYAMTSCKTQLDGYTDRHGVYRRYRMPKISDGC